MIFKLCLCSAALLSAALLSPAAIIGTNVPAFPLTLERIATLPPAQQPAWQDYLQRSEHQMQADKDFFYAEMKGAGLSTPTNGPYARDFSKLPLKSPPSWYGSNDARHMADVIISFQTPAGGWSKRLDMITRERQPGERYTGDNGSHFATNGDLDMPHDPNWNYVGTYDNDATTTQLYFLAHVIAALPADDSVRYRASFLSGLNYIANSQYPNGGWPQVWPLQGGYHDAITYNDDAMIHILELLNDITSDTNSFAFVPQKSRDLSAMMLQRGIQCVLKSQIVVKGHRTVWCQQDDLLTLQPTSARNYEMPCACAAESADLTMFLMKLPKPSPDIVASVNAAIAWFRKTAIYGYAFKFTTLEGRQLISSPGAGPIWARYYDIKTDKPIFGDRDKTIHDQIREISAERRKGYSWYGNVPKRALEHYTGWSKQFQKTGRRN